MRWRFDCSSAAFVRLLLAEAAIVAVVLCASAHPGRQHANNVVPFLNLPVDIANGEQVLPDRVASAQNVEDNEEEEGGNVTTTVTATPTTTTNVNATENSTTHGWNFSWVVAMAKKKFSFKSMVMIACGLTVACSMLIMYIFYRLPGKGSDSSSSSS